MAQGRRAARQPQLPETEFRHALEATAARLGLALSEPAVLVQAVTHVSYAHGKTADNSRLAMLGTLARRVRNERKQAAHSWTLRLRLGAGWCGVSTGDHLARFHAFEHVYVRYPHLPARALPAAVESFAGTESLAAWGRTVGLNNVVRWTPPVFLPSLRRALSTGTAATYLLFFSMPLQQTTEAGNLSGLTTVLGQAVQGLVGAVYHDQVRAARRFPARRTSLFFRL